MLLHNRLVDHISLHLKQGSELVESLLRHYSSVTGEVVVPLERLLKLSTKEKVVNFSSSVEEVTYRPNSSLQSKSAKNRRKAEKKRRRMEKRNSESSQDDSGLASSFEDDYPRIIIEGNTYYRLDKCFDPVFISRWGEFKCGLQRKP